ncbi:MAG: tRNA pseudouridine(13) synthase TruD [Isosphaeraceae bacterium]
MKVKRLPEDFQVEELSTVGEANRGRHTLYRLTKRGLGTLEAVEIICRRWNLAGRQVSYGGLKDRHAVTIQYLTILDGPRRRLSESSIALEPVGRLPHPYGPRHFSGNRFSIVLRDLSPAQVAGAIAALDALPGDGLPNYFDDQRFGSVGFSGQFIGHAWLKGDHERALRLALAEPNPFDRPGVKTRKAIVRECWGRWSEAKARLERSSTRSIVTYLVDHPSDFRGAFARLKRELRTLQFSAFQSHLWNLLLSGWITRQTRSDQRVMVDLKLGPLAFPFRLDPEERKAIEGPPLPLPSARTPRPEGVLGELVAEVLGPFDLEWNVLRVRHLKDVFFSKGTRPALVAPSNLQAGAIDDELHPKRQALRMSFDLNRGSYATILIKRITQAAEPAR